MHIALVYNRFRADGGTERMALNTFQAMASQDMRFTVVARQWRGAGAGNVEFCRCAPWAVGRSGKLRTFARAACRELARMDMDFVQSQVPLTCCDVYRADGGAHAEWLAQRARILGPWRRTYQRLYPYQRLKLALERRMYAGSRLRAVICNSPMVRDDISRHYPGVSDKLHVIENAIDAPYYWAPEDRDEARQRARREFGIESAAPLFVFVGSGFERKGVAVAIRALAGLDKAHLLIVGRDSRMRRYRKLARDAGLSGRVHFAGPRPDVRPYLWAAEALVHPALYEPFGLVVLEAMAAGLPVIASDCTGAALALVRSEEMGRVLDPLDIAGYAAAMRTIVARDEACRDEARRACEAAAGEYTLSRMRERLLGLYHDLLSSSTGRT